MQLSRKQKLFLNFLVHFWNLVSILNIFKKKMTLIAEVFPKLQRPKNNVRSISIKTRFKGSFKNKHGKCVKTLFKFAWKNLYHIY